MNNQKQQIHIEQLVQQLISQTQQASMQYQQLLTQEQQNAKVLEQIAEKEKQAAQIIQTALQGHQTATNQLNEIKSLCSQISVSSNLDQAMYSSSSTQQNSNSLMNH